MFGFIRQSLALSGANLRSLPRRAWISLSMVLSVTLVVLVLLGFLAMANGFRKTLSSTGSADVAMVLSRGAFSEALSRIGTQQAHLIEEAPGIARTAEGAPLISRELVVPVDAVAQDSGKNETLSLRGVTATGLTLRPKLAISAGRMMTPGTDEIVVGARLAAKYNDLNLGDTISFGRSQWKVVGHFTAGGSVFESELLADAGLVQAQFNRPNQIQSLRVRLEDPAAFAQFSAYVEDLDLGLLAQTEQAFYAAQASDISRIILFLGWPLAIVMAIGMNTPQGHRTHTLLGHKSLIKLVVARTNHDQLFATFLRHSEATCATIESPQQWTQRWKYISLPTTSATTTTTTTTTSTALTINDSVDQQKPDKSVPDTISHTQVVALGAGFDVRGCCPVLAETADWIRVDRACVNEVLVDIFVLFDGPRQGTEFIETTFCWV